MEDMFSGYALTTGAVRLQDLAYVLGIELASSETPRPRSRVFIHDSGRWLPPIDLDWNARSCAVCQAPEERLIAISEYGYVLAIGGGNAVVESRIARGNEMPGPLTEVRSISGFAHAVGTLRQVYVRDRPGQWRRIDDTCRATGPAAANHAFRDIGGFSPAEIYAVGWEGQIWEFDGRFWTQRETPTNLAFHCVVCAGDGFVYVVGQRGMMLRGRHDRWEVIEHEATEDDLWSCAWFADRVFVATARLLYELCEGRLIPVNYGTELPPATCYHLSAAAGIMWSIGASDVMEFNGAGWTRVR